MYKLITIVLTRRMAAMMGRVVNECQYAFVESRWILDIALVANEIMDELLHKNIEGFLCKLDVDSL